MVWAGLPDCAIYRKSCDFRSPGAARFEVRLAPLSVAILSLEKVRNCDFRPKMVRLLRFLKISDFICDLCDYLPKRLLIFAPLKKPLVKILCYSYVPYGK